MKVRNQSRVRRNHGFTIAELMVVILIIGLLATLVVPKVMDQFNTAKWGKVRGDLSALSNALQSYAMANGGDFPDSLEQLVERDANGKSFLQQSVVPRDPWKNEYVYMPPEGNREYELWCYGKDGQPGGEGDDRDLSSQMVRDGQE